MHSRCTFGVVWIEYRHIHAMRCFANANANYNNNDTPNQMVGSLFSSITYLSSPSLSFAGSVYAAHICAPTRFNGSEFMHTVYQRCKVIKLYSQKHNQTWLVKLKNEINTNQKLKRVNLFKK